MSKDPRLPNEDSAHSATPHTRLGDLWESRGDLDAAAAEYRKAIELDPAAAEPRRRLEALSKKQMKRLDGVPAK